ncbi:MAG: tRNA (adenosine(37)-N6)-threonylcarbamoyltransferase complex transferase subunit TsaD, partial [Acidobacteriota bacterium]
MTEPNILGIETSCDETAASVVRGREIRSNVVASQV